MMKKATSLVFILIILFVFCLGISIQFKNLFKLETDFLSAFATLAAAVVAYFLVADWREQSFLNIFLNTSNKIKNLTDELFDSFDNFKNYLYEIKVGDSSTYDHENFRVLSKVFMNSIDNLLLEMDHQKLLLVKLKQRTNEYEQYYKNLIEFDKEIMSLVVSFSEINKDNNNVLNAMKIRDVLMKDNLKFQSTILKYKYLIKKDSDKIISDLLK